MMFHEIYNMDGKQNSIISMFEMAKVKKTLIQKFTRIMFFIRYYLR